MTFQFYKRFNLATLRYIVRLHIIWAAHFLCIQPRDMHLTDILTQRLIVLINLRLLIVLNHILVTLYSLEVNRLFRIYRSIRRGLRHLIHSHHILISSITHLFGANSFR